MENRVIIALILSMAVLFSYPYIISKIYPPQTKESPKEAVKTEEAPAEPDIGAVIETKTPPSPLPALIEELITVDAPLYSAVFTNLGAGLKSFKLKGYKTSLKETSDLVELSSRVSDIAVLETRIKTEGQDGRM
ncbi:MAG: hypothetical protein HY880_06600, partial [Deltaproteobacteria bacterium]|nr:hypothetical protein [Deltaproteobacteria bacterium]